MEGRIIRTVARAVIAAWQDKGGDDTIDNQQVLGRAEGEATSDDVSEALGYLGFRSCIEATSTPTLDNRQGITIHNVDIDCLRHYTGD